MKKLFSLLLVVCMLLTLVACKKEEKPADVVTTPTETISTTEDINETEPTETPIPTTPTLPNEYKPNIAVGLLLNGNDVIYDKDNIKITLTKYEFEGVEDIMYFHIQNNSNKKIMFGCTYAVVNGMTITCKNECSLVSENSAIITPVIASHDDREIVCEKAEDLKYLEFSFFIIECASDEYEDFSGLILENGVAVFQAENYDKSQIETVKHGVLVYEDEQIQIYMEKDCDPSLFYEFFPYTIVNKTGKPIIAGMETVEYSSDLATWYEKTSDCIDAEQIVAPNSYASGRLKIATSKMEHILTSNFKLFGYENTGIIYIYPNVSKPNINCNEKTFKIEFPAEDN